MIKKFCRKYVRKLIAKDQINDFIYNDLIYGSCNETIIFCCSFKQINRSK